MDDLYIALYDIIFQYHLINNKEVISLLNIILHNGNLQIELNNIIKEIVTYLFNNKTYQIYDYDLLNIVKFDKYLKLLYNNEYTYTPGLDTDVDELIKNYDKIIYQENIFKMGNISNINNNNDDELINNLNNILIKYNDETTITNI